MNWVKYRFPNVACTGLFVEPVRTNTEVSISSSPDVMTRPSPGGLTLIVMSLEITHDGVARREIDMWVSYSINVDGLTSGNQRIRINNDFIAISQWEVAHLAQRSPSTGSSYDPYRPRQQQLLTTGSWPQPQQPYEFFHIATCQHSLSLSLGLISSSHKHHLSPKIEPLSASSTTPL